MRQVADRAVRLRVDSARDEARERLARFVEHAERRVARAGQLARDVEHLREQRLEVALGDERATDLDQPAQPLLVETPRWRSPRPFPCRVPALRVVPLKHATGGWDRRPPAR